MKKIEGENGKRLLFIVDTTGSMRYFIEVLVNVILEILNMFQMVFGEVEIGVMFYRDYDHGSGSATFVLPFTSNMTEVKNFITTNGHPVGGGDDPEAQKTMLMMLNAFGMLDKDTLCIHYTDAPPHMDDDRSEESRCERVFIAQNNWEWKWQSIVNVIRRTQADILTVVPTEQVRFCRIYNEIGKSFTCNKRDSGDIMRVTMCAVQEELGFGTGRGNPNFVMPFSSISKRLHSDPSYLSRVITIMTDQMRRRGIDGAKDILTNKLTSEIWRSLSTFRDNPDVVRLKDLMSSFANGSNPKCMEIRKLIEESYDREGAFNEMFEHIPRGVPVHCLRASMLRPVRVSDWQDVFNLFGKEIADVIQFIHSLQDEMTVIPPNVSFASLGVIPIDATNDRFFSVITHLITKGYVASRRHSAIIALLCLNDERFAERARSFLMSIRGRWLNFELNALVDHGFVIPENLNASFARFMLSSQNRVFLTTSEEVMLRAFVNMTNIYTRFDRTVPLQITSFAFPDCDLMTTDLFECTTCHRIRPVSLRIIGTSQCAWCDGHSDEDADKIAPAVEKMPHVSCCKCKGIYAICRPNRLVVTAKCHYCRNGMKAPLVECRRCHRSYIYPDYDAHVPFVCHECLELPAGLPNRTVDIDIRTLFEANPRLFDITNIPSSVVRNLMGDRSGTRPITWFEKFVRDGVHHHFAEIAQAVPSESVTLYTPNKEYVHNVPDVLKTVMDTFTHTHSHEMTECMLCTSMVNSVEMVKICMRPECNGWMCVSCAYRWLSSVNVGERVEYAQCCCPFCRQPFSPKMAKFHPIAGVTIPPNTQEISLTHYLGWCISCNRVMPHSEHQCHDEPPVVHNFICHDCIGTICDPVPAGESDEASSSHVPENTDRIVTCKKCGSPVCKALVINGIVNHGCNHVQCQKCRYHVCAFPECGEAFPESGDCYGHMRHVHGSFYDPEVDPELHHHEEDDEDDE